MMTVWWVRSNDWLGGTHAATIEYLTKAEFAPEVREELHRGTLSAGHARALLPIEDPTILRDLAAQVIKQGLSVRQVEARVQALRKPKAAKVRRVDANTRAAEEKLRAKLGARVEINRKRGRGEIRIAFESEAELNRLYLWIVRG